MAKKNTLTIDTAKASAGLQVFEAKRKSFTTAKNTYTGSYLNTAGDATVRKLNNTVNSYYSEIDSLYSSLKSYTASYIRSVQNLENSLRDGLIPADEEANVQSVINAVNELLNGADPTDLEINPYTGEVIVNSSWRKERQMDIDPKINGSLTNKNARDTNRDAFVGAYVTHPRFTMFMKGLSPVPMEAVNASKYTKSQWNIVSRIQKDYSGFETVGRAAGTVASAVLTGGLSIPAVDAAVKGTVGRIGSKRLITYVVDNIEFLPFNIAYSISDNYNSKTKKVNCGNATLEVVENVALDGVVSLGRIGKVVEKADAALRSQDRFLKSSGEKVSAKTFGITKTKQVNNRLNGLSKYLHKTSFKPKTEMIAALPKKAVAKVGKGLLKVFNPTLETAVSPVMPSVHDIQDINKKIGSLNNYNEHH